MEKNWLIRTKNNHILGPVTKEKVRELFENGSIKGDDEICSGNGYWFFVREKDLVEKYLLSDNEQDFNPVSEAETVLAVGKSESSADHSNDITKVGLNIEDFSLEDSSTENSSIDNSPNEGKKK